MTKTWLPGGQTRMLQSRAWLAGPSHSSPPLDFGGLLQSLDLSCVPIPQVMLQGPKDVQSPHLPSTRKNQIDDYLFQPNPWLFTTI